jgi:hypothetical protein
MTGGWIVALLLSTSFALAASESPQTQAAAAPDPPAGQPATPATQTPPPDTSKEKKPKEPAGKSKDSKERLAKKKKKDRSQKQDGDESAAGDGAKAPKHPTWQPMPGIRLDFKTRIETVSRPVTPPASLDNGPLEWQDRRVGVEGTFFKRFSFEISHEFGKDFEEANDLSEKTAWKEAFVRARVSKALVFDAGRF